MDNIFKFIGGFFVVCAGLALLAFSLAPLVNKQAEQERDNKPVVFYVIENGKAVPHDGYITPDGNLVPVKPSPPTNINVYPPRRIFPLGGRDTGSKGATEPTKK